MKLTNSQIAGVIVLFFVMTVVLFTIKLSTLAEAKSIACPVCPVCPACPQATLHPTRTPPPSATPFVPIPCPEIAVHDLPDMAQIEEDLALAYIELEKAYEYGHRLYTSVPGSFNSEVAVTVNCIGAAMERIEGVGKRLELWSAMGTFECRE